MQEAFVRIWERWDKVGRLEEPTGYLYRAAMNIVRSRYRRASLALRPDHPPLNKICLCPADLGLAARPC